MDRRSRREFFRLAGVTTAGASAVFLAACGGDDDDDRAGGAGSTATGAGVSDVAILNSALDLEHTAVAAYTAGAALLEGELLELGRRLLEHEREHAGALAQAIRDLGGAPNEPKGREEYAQLFGDLRDEEDVLRFAVDLENTAVAAYIDALPKLSSGELRQTAAAIASSEAEHISLLLGALGEPQVPDGFVTGEQR